MPIYEYRCSACGHELEVLQKFSDMPLATCPSCRTDALVKQVSAAGFQLKGSGWYATDFKGGGTKPAAAKADDASNAGTKTGSDGDTAGGDAKGAAKGEAKSETAKSQATPAVKTGAPPVNS